MKEQHRFMKVAVILALGTAALMAADNPEKGSPEAQAPARPDKAEVSHTQRPERPDALFPPGRGRPDGFLNDSQRTMLRDAMEARREEFRALQEKIRQAESELRDAALSEKFDEKLVREKAEALSKLQSEQMVLRLKLFSAILPTLTAEQKERLRELPPQALGMVLMAPPAALREGARRLDVRPERRQDRRDGLERPPR